MGQNRMKEKASQNVLMYLSLRESYSGLHADRALRKELTGKIWQEYLPYIKNSVKFIKKRYPDFNIDDFLQEASFGLEVTLNKYDISMEASFKTYLWWWVFGMVMSYVNKNLKHAPLVSIENLESRELIRETSHRMYRFDGEEYIDSVDKRKLIMKAVRVLPNKEKWVIFYRFYRDMTLQEIADKLGIRHRESARVLEAKGLMRLRYRLQHIFDLKDFDL